MPGPRRILSLLREPEMRHYLAARLRASARRAARPVARRRPRRRERVAIALVQHLGDIVAAEPVARLVRRRHPDAELVWVVGRRYAELVAHHPEVDRVRRVGCLTEWIHHPRDREFDRVYDLHVPDRFCAVCRIRHRREPAPAGIDEGNYCDHGNLLRVFCLVGGLPPVDDGPRLAIPPRAAAEVDALRLPTRFAVFHAAANQAERTWPAGAWRELASAVVAETPVVEIGLAPRFAPDVPGAVDLTGRLSILGTAELLRRAALFVGGDSGPAHLANAVGARGVLLLGRLGPFDGHVPWSGDYGAGRNVDVLRATGPVADLEPERVRRAVLGALAAGARR